MSMNADDLVAAVLAAAATNGGRVGSVAADRFCDIASRLTVIIAIINAVKSDTGFEVSVSAFADRRTVSMVCDALLEGRRSNAPGTLCIEMRPGVGKPTFLVPGISGAVVELLPLALRVAAPGPVYGLAFPGLDGLEPAIANIGALAARLACEIKSLGIAGPVNLVGYSAGGAVAVEIARLLPPDQVALLGLIDSPIHSKHWLTSAWLSFLASRITMSVSSKTRNAGLLERAADAPASAASIVPTGSARRFMRIAGKVTSRGWNMAALMLALIHHRYVPVASPRFLASFPFRAAGLPKHLQSVRDATIIAMGHEKPGVYGGPVTYYKTEGGDGMMGDVRSIWSRVAPQLTLVHIPGRHVSALSEPNVQVLGNLIR